MSGRRRSPQQFWWLVGLAGSVGIAGVVMFAGIPAYPAWLVGAGIMLFLLYGFDKQRAVAGGRRVPEMVLHGMALAGGVGGGWAGRAGFRHKTRKPVFLVVLVIATMLHAGLLVLWGYSGEVL